MKSRSFAPVPEIDTKSATLPKPKRQSVLDRIGKKMPLRPMPVYGGADEQIEEITDHTVQKGDDNVLVVIDARMIEQNAHPPRQIHTEEAIKQLADSIRKDGQRDAIHVIPHPKKPGRYIIGDGWTRVQAICAYDINGTTVLARVHHGMTEEDVSWLGYAQNEERKQHTDYDRSVFFSNWMKAGMQAKEIAERTGISPTLLSFYGSFSRLPSEALVLVKNNTEKVTATAAFFLCKIYDASDEAHLVRILHTFIEQEKTQKWLKDELEKLTNESKNGATTHHQSPSNKTVFRRDFAHKGFYKQRQDGRVEMALNIENTKVEQFNTELLSLISKYTNE